MRSLKEPKQNKRWLVLDHFADIRIVGLCTSNTRHGEVTGQSHLFFKEVADATGIGVAGYHTETGGAKEVLRH